MKYKRGHQLRVRRGMGLGGLSKVKSYKIIYSEKGEAYFLKEVMGFGLWSGSK